MSKINKEYIHELMQKEIKDLLAKTTVLSGKNDIPIDDMLNVQISALMYMLCLVISSSIKVSGINENKIDDIILDVADCVKAGIIENVSENLEG